VFARKQRCLSTISGRSIGRPFVFMRKNSPQLLVRNVEILKELHNCDSFIGTLYVFIGSTLFQKGSDCRKSHILTGRRGRRPLQMAILRIMNVGANCVRPQTTMFIDKLEPFFKRVFLNNSCKTLIKGL